MCGYVRVVSAPQTPALAKETVGYLVSLLMNEVSRPISWDFDCRREQNLNRIFLFGGELESSITIEFDSTPLPMTLAQSGEEWDYTEMRDWCSGVDIFLVVFDLSESCTAPLWVRKLYHAVEHFVPHATIQYLAAVRLTNDEAEPIYEDIRDYIDAVERRHRLCLNTYSSDMPAYLFGSLYYIDYFYQTKEILWETYNPELLGRIGVAFAYSSAHTVGVMGYLEVLLLIIRTLCHVRVKVCAEEHQVYNLLINTNIKLGEEFSRMKKWWSNLFNRTKEIRIALVGNVANGKTYTFLDLIHAIEFCFLRYIKERDSELMNYRQVLTNQLRDRAIKGTRGVQLGSLTLSLSTGKKVRIVLQDVAGEAFVDPQGIGDHAVTAVWSAFVSWLKNEEENGTKYSVQKTTQKIKLILPDDNATSSQAKEHITETMSPLEILRRSSEFDDESFTKLFKKYYYTDNNEENLTLEAHFTTYFKSFAFISCATDIVYCYLGVGSDNDRDNENYIVKVNEIRTGGGAVAEIREYVLFRGLDTLLNEDNFKKILNSDGFKGPTKFVSFVLCYNLVHMAVLYNYYKRKRDGNFPTVIRNLCSRAFQNVYANDEQGGKEEEFYSNLINYNKNEAFFNVINGKLGDWRTGERENKRIEHVYFGAYPISAEGHVGQFDAEGQVTFPRNDIVGPFANRQPLGAFNLLFDILRSNKIQITEEINKNPIFRKLAGIEE